ncbi:leucine-rich melanocyte differentiation-associated protein-like isoform X1 [Leptopilina boulardi]|uniref:leucine-rich melanocyte differentiation-associated protein-like isoform X1 n=2 Tax=Leptopilina boulardi TaxID=63433 RepID=UPI0021F600A2|nr:leucine-rich melanocyte differentiation-associated protein-like isoform X1 [Leptopilina boulardi]
MSGIKNEEFGLEDAVEEFAMTSLGKLIFVDSHSRHSKSLSSDESSNLDFNESLSLAFESLFHMPYDIIENYANSINTLDISHNKFSRNLQFLSEFENLTSLNLDHNNIDSFTIFPYMPKLQLLWINHNQIDDLFPFIKSLYESLPNLRYLCLMGNKAAPSYLNGGSFYDYLQYRLVVISWFPRLIHLDDRIITDEQRLEATRLFKRPLLEQFTENAVIPECIKVFHSKLSNMFVKNSLPEKLQMSKNSNFII